VNLQPTNLTWITKECGCAGGRGTAVALAGGSTLGNLKDMTEMMRQTNEVQNYFGDLRASLMVAASFLSVLTLIAILHALSSMKFGQSPEAESDQSAAR
tara:strand:+ start:5764 stop:6060 length:297 start_codon:yes stop_codon:yes gene_type:complete